MIEFVAAILAIIAYFIMVSSRKTTHKLSSKPTERRSRRIALNDDHLVDAFGFLERHDADALQLCSRRFRALIDSYPQSLPMRIVVFVDYHPFWNYFYIKTEHQGSIRRRNAPLQTLVDTFRNCSISLLAICGRFRDSDHFVGVLDALRGAVLIKSLALDPAPITLATRGRFKGFIADDHYHQAFDRLVELLPGLRAIRVEHNSLPPKRLDDSFLERCRTRGLCKVRNAGGVTEQGIMEFIFARPSIDEMIFLEASCPRVSRDFVKNLINRCEQSSCGQDETTRETAGIALTLRAEGISEQLLGPQYEKYARYIPCLRILPRWHIETEGEPRVIAMRVGPLLLFWYGSSTHSFVHKVRTMDAFPF